MKIETGQLAPDFQMYDTDKNPVRLSSQKGKNVVLLFFPFAFTSTCTAELCSTRDDIAFYDGVNASVFGISVDAPYSLKVFKQEQKINFPLLSDFNKIVMETFGCMYDRWGMELKGVAKRSAFIIDAQGIVQYIEILENASDLPNFEKIKEVLSGLK